MCLVRGRRGEEEREFLMQGGPFETSAHAFGENKLAGVYPIKKKDHN